MTGLEQLLHSLIRIPSPNPPGDTQQLASFISDWLQQTNVQIETLSAAEKPEAKSVIARLGQGSPVVMFHAHIDTVPIAVEEAKHWSSDPYEPTLKDGKLYGKGSIDDKAPLAAMMWAFKKQADKGAFQGTLLLVAAAEEETGGQLGTHWLAEQGHLPECDFIVVGEQTNNQIALAHKGVMRATITTYGRSVHATNPDRGVNAITAMARVVLALEHYHQELSQRKHPLVGTATCNVGTIQGGSTANAVPDSCTIRIDRRMIPREDPEGVKQELKDRLSSVAVSPASVEIGEFLFSSWFDSKLETALGKSFLESVQSYKDPGPIGYLPGSDAKHLMKLAKGDMVIFGPGSYERAHAFDEYVELSTLNECETILSDFLQTLSQKQG
jgi:acetylornithine deacetylase/succinyl-diaminopimelate desuccinylase family protein